MCVAGQSQTGQIVEDFDCHPFKLGTASPCGVIVRPHLWGYDVGGAGQGVCLQGVCLAAACGTLSRPIAMRRPRQVIPRQRRASVYCIHGKSEGCRVSSIGQADHSSLAGSDATIMC